MDVLRLLATALCVAALAGVNLYLTVFLLGLSLRMDWIQLGAAYDPLRILEHPALMALSGTMFLIEFLADKVAWVDSFWDALHTAVRPLGATFLALGVLGSLDPLAAVAAGLLCGGVALTSHLTKAGTRLLVNASPEPASNVFLSLFENLAVAGGVFLVFSQPWLSLGLLVLFLALFFWLAPRFFRYLCATGRFIISKLRSVGAPEGAPPRLPALASTAARQVLERQAGTAGEIAWAVPVVAGSVAGLRDHDRALLLLWTGGRGRELWLVAGSRTAHWRLPELRLEVRYRVLYDELLLRREDAERADSVRFLKHQRAYFTGVLRELAALGVPEEKTADGVRVTVEPGAGSA